jgi:MraZ protein
MWYVFPQTSYEVGNKYRGVSHWVDSQHMLFTSIHELSIDSKNRLSIPAGIRSALDAKQDGTNFYLVPGDWNRTLYLYSDKYFERYAEKYHASLEPGPDKQMFETVFYAMATQLDLDKQGRVVIPQRIMDENDMGRQVVLSGARDHLVLWNRADFELFMSQNRARLPDLLRRAQLETKLSRQNGAEH